MTRAWNAVAYDQKFSFVSGAGAPILARLAACPGERILDLGCGTGELAAQIAEAGAEVVGLDADPAMIERASQRFPHLAFVPGNAETFPWPQEAGRFDAVFSNAALHWMKPGAVLPAVRRVLRRDGRFVGEFGGQGNVAAVTEALDRARAEQGLALRPGAWFFPSIATFAALLEAAGYQPRWLELVDRPTALAGGASGLSDWLDMFAGHLLEDLTVEQRAAVVTGAIAHARAALWREDGWVVDYRRLRFEAVAI